MPAVLLSLLADVIPANTEKKYLDKWNEEMNKENKIYFSIIHRCLTPYNDKNIYKKFYIKWEKD